MENPEWRNTPMEPNIKGLVEVLDTVPGVRTRASCQGHVFPASPPYIMFDAPVDFASVLEKGLREDALSASPVLHTLWAIEGMFDAEYELCFRLYAHGYNRHKIFA